MEDETDKAGNRQRPDLVRDYRPVAIHSVLAAHAMMPKSRSEAAPEPASPEMDFVLPAGFRNSSED
ncbi:hypothetical protein [Shinella zoogloeoides]|uniref:hypothetical protein n=1 Tax=Shinella zoogloeoides TaxID=352475 RepID=UPI00273D7ADE|nr:hypothetical protein [Shinella zoogloeoides]WLR92973.1 hypothetical protein Q9316_01820 [Shinella zoogloeoides]